MKNFSRSVILLCVLALAACRDKDAFVISGKIENPDKLKKIYLLQPDTATSFSMQTIDSTSLSDDSKFFFKHQGYFPSMYKILIGSHTYDIIAKNGDEISFTLNGKDTTGAYTISGSDDSELMLRLNKMSNHFSDVTTTLSNEYGPKAKAAKNKSDSDALYALYYPKFIANMDNYGKAALGFIDSNKNSLAGFVAAKTLDRFKYEQQLVAYADEIKDKFPGNHDVATFVKAMELVKPVSVGHKAPDFTITDSNGKPASLADYKGKYVMLDFWASWCAPCRQENPNVVKQYAMFKDKGLNILSITLDEDRKAWLDAAAHDKLTWRHAGEFKRFDGPTVKLYNVQAIPSNFIIDPNGVIVAKNITGPELEAFLSKTFK